MQDNILFPFGSEILHDPRVKELPPWDRCYYLELLLSPRISPEGIVIIPMNKAVISPEKAKDSDGSAVISGFDGPPRSFLSNDFNRSAVARDSICISSSVFKRNYQNIGVDIDKLPSSLKTKNLVALEFNEGAGYLLLIDYLRWSMDRLKHSKKSRGEITEYCANATHLTKLPQIHKRLVSTYPGLFPPLSEMVRIAPTVPLGFVVDIELKDGSLMKITDEDLGIYRNMFPRLDLKAEFAKMAHWCAINPSKRKTRSGFGRFVMNWLSNADSRAASRPAPRTIHSKPLI